jgi:AcrR family transcriptional regulator
MTQHAQAKDNTMKVSRKRATTEDFVWDRAEPTSRPAPTPLTRELILRAALKIADKEGLASVSLRKIGASLDAGPMRLYGYVSTKEELFDLMADAVYGEIVSKEPLAPDWREAFRTIAHRIRVAAQKHTWFVDLMAGRAHWGPNLLAHREQVLSVLGNTPGFEDIDDIVLAVRAVHSYVIGAIWSEANELRAERESGMNKTAWQQAQWPYIQRVIATGRIPMLAKVIQNAKFPPDSVVFDKGLDWVLDGIAAQLAR